MKQLSGLDASFLYLESSHQFGHVSSLLLFAVPDDGEYDLERLAKTLAVDVS